MTASLFSGAELRGHLTSKVEALRRAVASYDANRLLNSNVDDLVQYFVSLGEVEAVSLGDEVTLDQQETTLQRRDPFPRHGAYDVYTVPATQISLHVPFRGDPQLTSYVPSTRTCSPPEGYCATGELVLFLTVESRDAADTKRRLDSLLHEARRWVSWLAADIDAHNRSLNSLARAEVEARRRRLLENQNLAAAMGFPIRERANAPATYALPDVRRRALPTPPPASSAPFAPEPTLDEATYERILTIVGSMVRVMEQSPRAFAGMNEEDLRTHFLVQLNGQFEGRATAETFRGSGSTDILLVEQDKSAFIAECKFWTGPASLTGAVDQLLDYATWRDAKAAILVFSRRGDFGKVVDAIAPTLSEHPQNYGSVDRIGETVFRSKLRQRDDSGRLIRLTTMAFNVPVDRSESGRLTSRRKVKQ